MVAAMDAFTLIFALMDSDWADTMLKASIAATILVPVLLYGMILMARVLKKDDDPTDGPSDIQ